jgi:hypothetical protein
MNIKKLLFIFFAIFLANSSFAVESLGTVKEFMVTNSDAVRISLAYKGGTAEEDCNSGSAWKFEFYNSDSKEYKKQWVSMFIAAKLSGQDIRVGYTPNSSGICSVNYVYFPE